MVEPKKEEKSQKRIEREAYYKRKGELVEFEKTNYDKIVFLKGTGGFWIVGGHSAVILANKIGKELKIRVPLKKDTDFDFRFKEGKISVRNLEYYRRELVGAKVAEMTEKTDEKMVLKLKKKVGKEEYELLANMKELRRQQLEKEILKTVPMPRSHMHITEAMRVAFRTYSKYTDRNAKEVFGAKLMEEVRTAHKIFLLVCMNEVPLRQGLEKIRQSLTRALAGVMQMAELDIWTVEDTTAVATAIAETKMSLEREEQVALKMLARAKVLEASDGESGKN